MFRYYTIFECNTGFFFFFFLVKEAWKDQNNSTNIHQTPTTTSTIPKSHNKWCQGNSIHDSSAKGNMQTNRYKYAYTSNKAKSNTQIQAIQSTEESNKQIQAIEQQSRKQGADIKEGINIKIKTTLRSSHRNKRKLKPMQLHYPNFKPPLPPIYSLLKNQLL